MKLLMNYCYGCNAVLALPESFEHFFVFEFFGLEAEQG
jgi:hypothetical protein